jgi:hypothetical protein
MQGSTNQIEDLFMSSLETYAKFVTNDAHHDLFRNGHLVEDWSSMYPMLFDSDDTRIALHQRHLGYHYYEWLAAILIYHTTGFLSLIEAYAYESHARKRIILETLVTGEALDLIASHGISSAIQCPDLLVYAPGSRKWFFCEVKGPRDKLREKQLNFFDELARVSGKEIKVVHFQAANQLNPA